MNWNMLGQFFGFVAVILGFMSFQMKPSKNLLVVQTFVIGIVRLKNELEK